MELKTARRATLLIDGFGDSINSFIRHYRVCKPYSGSSTYLCDFSNSVVAHSIAVDQQMVGVANPDPDGCVTVMDLQQV